MPFYHLLEGRLAKRLVLISTGTQPAAIIVAFLGEPGV